MGWIGKVIGGIGGFALLGPLGGILGVAFGHIYDKADNLKSGEEHQDSDRFSTGTKSAGGSSSGRKETVFFTGVFSMLGKIAQADGHLDESEELAVRNFMIYELKLDAASCNNAMKIFHAARTYPEPFANIARQFYQEFSDRPEMLEMMVDMLLRVSLADKKLSKSEEDLILQAVKIFGFSDQKYKMIRSRYVDDSDRWYGILDLTPSCTDDEIKKSYRKLVKEYHPDAIASRGMPDDFKEMSNHKFREIQLAYEELRKKRGFA